MPKFIYDSLGFESMIDFHFYHAHANGNTSKIVGRVNNVQVHFKNKETPIDFIILEATVKGNIILGRSFLRTVGAIIDMKEGTIRFQFPLKKGMEHFPRKKLKLPFESVIRASYGFDIDKT